LEKSLFSIREKETSSLVDSDGYPLSENVNAISPKKKMLSNPIKTKNFFTLRYFAQKPERIIL
jgi:hypothetical protein